MNNLNKTYRDALTNVKIFNTLSSCRYLDFPNNSKKIFLHNMQIYFDYYTKTVLAEFKYNPKGDYILVANILNCLSSIKSYLNRKKREIENKDIDGKYKMDLQNIFLKYWKSKRNDTPLDNAIILRDKFEHEKISGISIETTYNEDAIIKKILIDEIDFSKLMIDVFGDIEKLDKELKLYVEKQLNILNLRHNILLLNAFHRFFKKKPYSYLMPEETEEEKEHYDSLVLSLKEQ